MLHRWMLAVLLGLLLCSAAAKEMLQTTDCGGGIHVLQSAPWPGGGLEVLLAVGWQSAVFHPAVPAITVEDHAASVEVVQQIGGLTAFLIIPDGKTTIGLYAAVAQAAADTLPRQERIVIFTMTNDHNDHKLQLIADATLSRSLIATQLARMLSSFASIPVDAPSDKASYKAVTQALMHLTHLNHVTGDGSMRTLVIVGATDAIIASAAPTGLVDVRRTAVSLLFASSSAGKDAFDPGTSAVGIRGDRDGAIHAGEEIAAAVVQRRRFLFRAGLCLKRAPRENGVVQLKVTSARASATCRLQISDWATVADNTAACAADDVAMAAFPYPDRLTFLFTADQEAVFESQRAVHNGTYDEELAAKDTMNLSVAFSGDTAGRPIAAKAHFRGSSTLRECERKSLTVHLDGARALQPGGVTSRLVLISMCEGTFAAVRCASVRAERGGEGGGWGSAAAAGSDSCAQALVAANYG